MCTVVTSCTNPLSPFLLVHLQYLKTVFSCSRSWRTLPVSGKDNPQAVWGSIVPSITANLVISMDFFCHLLTVSKNIFSTVFSLEFRKYPSILVPVLPYCIVRTRNVPWQDSQVWSAIARYWSQGRELLWHWNSLVAGILPIMLQIVIATTDTKDEVMNGSLGCWDPQIRNVFPWVFGRLKSL